MAVFEDFTLLLLNKSFFSQLHSFYFYLFLILLKIVGFLLLFLRNVIFLTQLYMEDALGDRIWVDHEECRPFVENIVTAFNTRIPPKALLTPELSGALTGTRDTSSPITVDDEAREGRNTPELLSISAHDKEGNADVPILPR